MNINAKELIKKIKFAYQVTTNPELAEKLGITLSAIEQWSKKNKVPEKYITRCTFDTGVSFDWLLSEDKPTFHISGGSKNISQVTGGVGIQETTKNDVSNIDEATLSLFKEAYIKAKENDKINQLRVYLMEFK